MCTVQWTPAGNFRELEKSHHTSQSDVIKNVTDLHFMADVATTLRADQKYVNLPAMGSTSEDEEEEHFVLPNQLRLRSNYEEKK